MPNRFTHKISDFVFTFLPKLIPPSFHSSNFTRISVFVAPTPKQRDWIMGGEFNPSIHSFIHPFHRWLQLARRRRHLRRDYYVWGLKVEGIPFCLLKWRLISPAFSNKHTKRRTKPAGHNGRNKGIFEGKKTTDWRWTWKEGRHNEIKRRPFCHRYFVWIHQWRIVLMCRGGLVPVSHSTSFFLYV